MVDWRPSLQSSIDWSGWFIAHESAGIEDFGPPPGVVWFDEASDISEDWFERELADGP